MAEWFRKHPDKPWTERLGQVVPTYPHPPQLCYDYKGNETVCVYCKQGFVHCVRCSVTEACAPYLWTCTDRAWPSTGAAEGACCQREESGTVPRPPSECQPTPILSLAECPGSSKGLQKQTPGHVRKLQNVSTAQKLEKNLFLIGQYKPTRKCSVICLFQAPNGQTDSIIQKKQWNWKGFTFDCCQIGGAPSCQQRKAKSFDFFHCFLNCSLVPLLPEKMKIPENWQAVL